MNLPQTSQLEISRRALMHNFKALKNNLSGETKIMCVVKGNAYGHGLVHVVNVLTKMRPDFFAVFDIQDALIIRKITKTIPILVLAAAQDEYIDLALSHNLSLSVSSNEILSRIIKKKIKGTLKIHLCIETGLGRDGILHGELEKTLARIKNQKHISIEGLYTHFSGAESRTFDTLTKSQVKKLLEWQAAFNKAGMHPLTHASGTAGSMLGEESRLSMCRIGIGLYGLWPSEETKKLSKRTVLKPVLSWKTRVIDVKEIPKGHGIGYDMGYITKTKTTIAIIPVGYYDGIGRGASNRAFALVRRKRVPIRGRIMMNMCVLDVTGLTVNIGDEVVLIGKQGNNSITVEDWGKWADTINYEITTKINPLLPRVLAK